MVIGKLLYMAYYFTPKIRRKIGMNIKRTRKKLGLKQVEVAVDAGLNTSYYGKIERGLINPSLKILYRIIKALKVSSSDILPF
jgi:transcriptional regulator with XRE-family HTH domain